MKTYINNEEIGAFFFHYRTPDGKILKPSGKLIDKDRIMTRYQYDNVYGKNDECICYLKRAVEQYRYPEFDGETYVAPTVIQMDMADRFKIVFSKQVVGVAEYLEGGLTRSGRKLRLRSPMGMMYYSSLMMSSKARIGTQIKYAISIWPYARLANKSFSDVIKMGKRPALLLATYIPGQLLYMYWRMCYGNKSENC